jgi:hypothetical protein
LPAPFGSNTASTGIVVTEIDGERTLVTDQSGKKRISKTNALGQLTDVWEITTQDSNTVAISFGNPVQNLHGYQTSYQYDTLSNLVQVNQGFKHEHSHTVHSQDCFQQQTPKAGQSVTPTTTAEIS